MSIMTFATFTHSLRYVHRNAVDSMSGQRQRFANPTADLSQMIRSYHDDAMKATHVLKLTAWLAIEHEKLCLESLDAEPCIEWWDGAVDNILKTLYSYCMERIWQGVNSSSNPLSIVESTYEVEAHKTVLSHFCGYRPMSSAIVDDIFEGMNRRVVEAEAKVKVTPRKVTFHKQYGSYQLNSRNADSEVLETRHLNTGRKPEAKILAEQWAAELYGTHKVSIIIEEG